MPPLREELELGPGPAAHDGSPTWTIADPATGRFARLGWAEFEMLRRWGQGTPTAIAEAVSAETSLRLQPPDVLRFASQLQNAQLLRPTTPQAVAQLAQRHAAGRQMGWAMMALKHYLFFRVPLVRPDRVYAAMLERLSWIFSRSVAVATIAAGLIGVLLVARQWDVFLASFPHLATGEGIAMGLGAIALLKILHELGHGIMVKRFGCHVRTAGIAVMLFVPMLYTDTTDAWRLTDRRQRLLIGAAGILVELSVACWALLLWNFLPEGPLRSIAFVWATTTWVLTLLINANPLMRFDGYYILSDAMNQPNLQDRAFAMGRWHMRRHLLGLRNAPPMAVDARRRRTLIAYAYAVWIYRLSLFMGVAALVYLMSFKLLGLFLAAIEVGWFILRPIIREAQHWWSSRTMIGVNPTMIRTIMIAVALVLAALVPWHSTVHGDALVGAERRTVLFAPAPAQIAGIAATPGQRVRQGDVLFRLSAPQLDHDAATQQRNIDTLGLQIDAMSQQQDLIARVGILTFERDAARQQLASAEAARQQLELRAPFDGIVVEMADPLHDGEWVERGEPLALVVDPSSTLVEALVAEVAMRRLAVGGHAHVRPRNPDMRGFDAVVETIDHSALRELPDVALASTHGGPIPARNGPNNVAVPETPVYRVRLRPLGPVELDRLELATVRIQAEAESLVARIWRHAVGVVIRESGF